MTPYQWQLHTDGLYYTFFEGYWYQFGSWGSCSLRKYSGIQWALWHKEKEMIYKRQQAEALATGSRL